MEYFTKVIIDGNEYAEMDNPAHPYITNVKLMQGTSLEAMEIGAAAVDQLVFTFYNPPRRSFDGDKVEFWISPNEDLARDDLAIIEDEVGSDAEEEAIDVDETLDLEDDDDSGDTPTPAEIDAALAAEATDTENTYDFFNGTDTTPQSETTDESAEPEWRKVGEFYVYKQSATEDGTGLILECLDVVSQLVDIFVPTVATDTVQNLFDDFRAQVLSQYGITVLEHPFTTAQNIEITWKEQNTYREALSRFAGIAGGFAAVDEDSNIGISYYTFCDSIALERDFTMYCETSAGELHLQRIDCNRSLTGRDFISSGEGQFISFTNPYVTQEMLDEMLAMYTGTRYSGAEVTMMWDGASQAGEFIRVMTSAEYANYVALNNALDDETDPDVIIDLKYNLNGLGRVLLISNQTIAFAGDAIATVQSIAETEYYKAYKQETKQKAQLRHLFKDVENLDTLIRESADGIEVGKVDENGDYITGHTLIDAADNAYKIIDGNGNTVATFADSELQYARNGVITVGLAIGSAGMKLQDLRSNSELRLETTASLKCNGTGTLDLDSNGVCDVNGGYTIDGNAPFKLIKAHNLETSPMPADSFTANDVLHEITSIIPADYEVLNVTVSGTGYNCVNVYRLTWSTTGGRTYILYRLRNFGDTQVTATPYVNIILIHKGLL